jgi:hypothetical protein
MAFAPGPVMATPREGCAAVALDEHRIILVAGGFSGSEYLNTTEILDFRTMAFAPGPRMGSERSGCAAVPVDAQHVLIVGGQNMPFLPLATTELLDLAALEFAPGPAMQTERYACAATRLDTAGEEPRILVYGGTSTDEESLSSTEVLSVDRHGARAAPRRR